ncbi:Short-chain dehydrogenase TIC 32 [Diplonema papillatum]|nr:Short-chain dehydrogenase TIC 32 [Diplonema papillatum]
MKHVAAKVESVLGDIGTLSGAKALAERVKERFPTLNVLVNNAGIWPPAERQTSPDGFELTWAVNHLGPSLLTLHLLDTLRQNQPSRIVFLSSKAHEKYGMTGFAEGTPASELDYDNLNSEKFYIQYNTYATSKIANTLFANALDRKLRAAGGKYEKVAVNSLHPGTIDTKLMRGGNFGIAGSSLEEGVRTPVLLAVGPSVEGVTGEYFSDGAVAKMNPIASRPAELDKFWDLTLAQTREEAFAL